MVGASGAIAGVLGAYLLIYPQANVRVFVWIVIFFRLVNVPAWILLGLWFGMQLVSGLMRAPGTPGVAFWAHIGGFVSGLILVSLLRPSGVPVPPGALARPRSSQRGSVPAAGRPHRRPSDIWG